MRAVAAAAAAGAAGGVMSGAMREGVYTSGGASIWIAVVYRFANTRDAMWGDRGRREWAGKRSPCADDLLSWVPARLTPRSPGAADVSRALALSPRAAWPAVGAVMLGLWARTA